MAILDVELLEESQTRYLTYALSVVNSRALPDVRDGLKPVQRRILYAMVASLHLSPEKPHRKSAAVVGEVLARFHPHGDTACYDALVRMAQDFNFRYPLVDGQGNFGSLDGDAAAAYRYTEARLTQLALEVIGEIGQETVAQRDNFDQTTLEPVVLPSRVPNLLINGCSGIAVGMATSIPPHNLKEVIDALCALIENPELPDSKLLNYIKAPDFPTGCSIVNTKEELKQIYTSGRGAIRMRANYTTEQSARGKKFVIITSIPYNVDKSNLVAKIADLIISKKVPQYLDVRDESTSIIRIVLELSPEADPDKGMAYLYKHTALQQNFNVNLTALAPTDNPFSGKPALMSLREMLNYFLIFRITVTRNKLNFEKNKLEERLHLLEGLILIADKLNEAIEIVRKSEGRQDAAQRLQKRFKLSELQSFFIVDLRIYQLSKTSVEETTEELNQKKSRVAEINAILINKSALEKEVTNDLKRIATEFGDSRRSKLITDYVEESLDIEEYIQHEEVHVIVTSDGWIKRIRQSNDPLTTRLREGDRLFFAKAASTRDCLAVFTNLGNVFITKILELNSTSGFGAPVQKIFKFQDNEQIVGCLIVENTVDSTNQQEILLATSQGQGFRLQLNQLSETKRIGRRLVKLGSGDFLSCVTLLDNRLLFLITKAGYGLCIMTNEIPLVTGAAKGVILQRIAEDDQLAFVEPVSKQNKLELELSQGSPKEIEIKALTIGSRAQRGLKMIKRGGPVIGLKKI